MNSRRLGYFEAVKKKPKLIFHVCLFLIMCWLSYKVATSLQTVFPDAVDLGQGAIIGRLACVAVLVAILVRASTRIIKMASFLLLIVVILEVGEFGCHWMYARELSASHLNQAEKDRQQDRQNEFASQNAARAKEALEAMAKFNQSQAALNNSDARYYQQTGRRVERKRAATPGLQDLGVIAATPTPYTATSEPQMVNGLGAIKSPAVSDASDEPLPQGKVLAKWSPRFVLMAILCLAFSFIGLAYTLYSWESDYDGDGLPDEPGK